MPKTELFIGNLSKQVSKTDIEDAFNKYGRILRCDLKSKSFGSSFCFLEFDDERDAEEALKNENGKDMDGSSMVVEWAKGKSTRENRRNKDNYYDDRHKRGSGDKNSFNRYTNGRNGKPRSPECFNCGEIGHFAKECRRSGSRIGYNLNGRNGSIRRSLRRDSKSRSRSRSR